MSLGGLTVCSGSAPSETVKHLLFCNRPNIVFIHRKFLENSELCFKMVQARNVKNRRPAPAGLVSGDVLRSQVVRQQRVVVPGSL